MLVDIRVAGDGYKLTVDAEQLGTVESESTYQFNESGRLADVIQTIEMGRCKLDHLRDVGSELYDSVFTGKTLELFESFRQATSTDDLALIRLRLPRALEQLPWEALYNEQYSGFVGTHPSYCIAREPLGETTPGQIHPAKQPPLTMLAVIPEGSGLNVEQEWHNLQQICEKHSGVLRAERIDGRVTPERLGARLEQKAYDIVHFIGHGEVSGSDSFTIRLNDPRDGEELWMDAETFASLFYLHPPRLAVLNCCLGAAASPKRSLTGMSPALVRSGVTAVVAMRYEIPDDVAAEFTNSFYRELLGGKKPGRVDSAVSCARQLIYRNKVDSTLRGFITPVLYLKHGNEHLFDLPDLYETEAEDKEEITVSVEVPETLRMCIEKLRRRDCIVVVGPGSLSSSPVTRSGKQAPTMRELAVRLATECNYPWAAESSSEKNTQDWINDLLLPWVCQHYQKVKRRYALIGSIEEAYNGVDPPAIFRLLTRLGIPGIVYTHFDGLIEKAFLERNTPVQTIAAVDQRFESDSGGTILLCPKGLIRLKDSLVLTEEDNERLYDRITQLSPVLRDRMRGQVGRSAVFVGVSPRDQLVRRIAGQLLEAGDSRTQGPTFFVSGYQSTGDDAYWGKYDVRWISCDIDAFTNLLRRELQ